MKNYYLAIWYGCNQRCLGCPVGQNENRGESLSAEDIRSRLEEVNTGEPFSVTVSGGEPTMHPDFFEILNIFQEYGAEVCILSNAERFADRDFCDEFLCHVELSRTTVVTTIHASCAALHESQNGSVGSLEKSIRGLQYLSFRGLQVSVKHCITAKNYEDTANFIRFIDASFHPSVDIQIWSLDYSGLLKEQAEELYVPFPMMRSRLEEALDVYLELSGRNYRRLSLHNIPLCSLDPFYWELMPERETFEFEYAEYLDPTTRVSKLKNDSGKLSSHCVDCAVQEYCAGAYRSLFEYFGDDVVTPVEAEPLE